MIRLTEPMPCPRCRRPVVPGEVHFYDLLDDDPFNEAFDPPAVAV